MPARTPYYVAITSTSGVIIQAVAEKIDPLAASLGYTKLPETGELPSGKSLAGTGKSDALQAGCIAVNLVYKVASSSGGKPKMQTAKVLVSPTKSGPTLFTDLRGKKYGTQDIAQVRVPRRRIYTF